MTKKKLFFWGKLICAFVFLFNPNLNLIDILPDAIGYLFLMLAIRNATDIFPHFDEAYRGFSRLFWISLAKFPAFYIMLRVVSINNYERSMVTVFALSFAVLEILFAIPAFRDFFAAFSHVGEKNGLMPFLAAGKSKGGISGLSTATYIFLGIKATLSFLPEISLLSVFETLGSVEIGAVNPARFYPIYLAVAFLIGTVAGIIWLYYVISYFNDVRKSDIVKEFLDARAEEVSLSVSVSSEKRIRKCALYLIIAALLCAFDVILDDKNYLPDILSALFFLLSFLLLYKESRFARFGILASFAYSVFALLAQVTERNFFFRFSYTDVAYKSDAAASYLWVEIWAVLEALSLIALLALLYLVLKDFTAVLLNGAIKEKNAPLEGQVHKELILKLKAFSLFGVISAVWPALETFLLTLTERHVVTAEEANEFFAEGHVLYYPVFGGSWFLGFVLTAAWAVLGIYFIFSLRDETRSFEDD